MGNIVTPTLRNWWAERSVTATKRRIGELERELTHYKEHVELLSEVDDHILKGIQGLSILAVLCADCVGVALLIWAGFGDKSHMFKGLEYVAYIVTPGIFAMLAFVVANLLLITVFRKLSAFRLNRSPMALANVEKSIKQLKGRLEKWQ